MPIEIDGLWTGHYELGDGSRYPVTVRFAQTAGGLRGEMTDGVTRFEYGPDEMRARGVPAAEVEALTAELYRLCPAETGEPFTVVTRLPPAADIVGYVQGGIVRFTKTYRGTSQMTWRVGRAALRQEVPGHAVEYEGELSTDERAVTGRWWIGAGKNGDRGRFELRRR